MDKRLKKSSDKMLAGCCAGLAEYFECDVTLFRIIYTILTVCTAFCGVLIYIILAILMPND